MIVWYKKFGIGFFAPETLARGGGSIYGPYDRWFERKFLCFYWSVVGTPKPAYGIEFF